MKKKYPAPEKVCVLLERSSIVGAACFAEGTCHRLELLNVLAVISSYLIIIQEYFRETLMRITDNRAAASVVRRIGCVIIFYNIALGKNAVSME